MLNVSLIISGAILLIYSLDINKKLLKFIFKKQMKKRWLILVCLIIFFIFSYLVVAYIFIGGKQHVDKLKLEAIIAGILFLGAVFVTITSRLIYITVQALREENEKSKKALLELNKSNQELIKRRNDLERTQELIINRELKMVELKNKLKK